MLRLKVVIEDDRGNKVPLFTESMLGKLSGEKADRVAAAAFDRSRHRSLGVGEIVVFGTIGAVALCATVMNDMGFWAKRSKWELIIPVVVLCSPLMVFALHSMRKTQALRIRTGMLESRLCASCGYDIPREAAPGAPPGFVQCPECGAWWKCRQSA